MAFVILSATLVGLLAVAPSGASAAEFEFKEDFSYGREANEMAIDDSCSFHNPVLTQSTVPTCEAFDPSFGDLYIVGFRFGVLKFNAKHEFVGRLELPDGNLEVFGVTVDQSNGDVYAADFEGNRVIRFNSSGVVQPSSCGVASKPTALAFDPSNGDLYVALYESRVVDKLDQLCKVVSQITGAPNQPFGEAMLGGLAVDRSTGDLYVGDSSHELVDKFGSSGAFLLQFDGSKTPQRSFRTAPQKLDVTVDQLTGDVYVADIEHKVIDRFSPSGEYKSQLEGSATSAGSFEDAHAVATDEASNELYVGDSSVSAQLKPLHEVVDVFKVFHPEDVVTLPASGVGPTSATLNGTVNPKGAQASSCRFEYVIETGANPALEYDHSVACAQTPAEIGSGGEPVPVSAEAGGLQPGVEYRFRLTAVLATGEERGEAEYFRTPVPPTVADEAVTDVASTSAVFSASINPGGGDTTYHFEYGTDTSYGGVVPVPDGDAGSGTASVPVVAYPEGLSPGTVYHFRVVATNVAGVAYGPDGTFETQPPGAPVALPDGRVWELVSPANKNGALILTSGQGGGGGAALQAAADGSEMSYSALGVLGEDAAGNAQISQVLSRRGTGGWSSRNISTPHSEAKGGTFVPEFHFFSFVDLSFGIVIPLDEPPLVEGGTRQSVYVRDNGTGTYALLNGLEGERKEEEWIKAMEEWHAEQASDLARWYEEHEPGIPQRPACESATAPTGGGAVVGASYDGCVVYFVSGAALAPGASAGANNLYRAYGGNGEWSVAFIAALSAQDAPDWAVGPEGEGISSRVSPSGRYLAFMSDERLTGYDNTDANSGMPDQEVFLYEDSAIAGRIVCVSCDPTGAGPQGMKVIERGGGFTPNPGPLVDYLRAWEGQWLAGSLTSARNTARFPAYYQPRNLSDSGRVFFDSPDALAPGDVNGREDVYEYEPPGMGGCRASSSSFSESSSGCVSLVSSGLSSEESAFLDASVSGDDAFFLTSARLTPQDQDTSFDVYDAHACSASSPCAPAPASPPPCNTSDSCKSPPLPQPAVFGSPPSATFSGPGNVSPPAAGRARSTPAQRLALALKACRHKPRKQRRRCEAQARRRYRLAKRAKGKGR